VTSETTAAIAPATTANPSSETPSSASIVIVARRIVSLRGLAVHPFADPLAALEASRLAPPGLLEEVERDDAEEVCESVGEHPPAILVVVRVPQARSAVSVAVPRIGWSSAVTMG
jgi:hypothetical protein